MIQLDYTTIGAKVIPERELTIEEKIGITSILTDGATMKITYYKGDEPKEEEIKFREVAAWKVRAILTAMGLIAQVETALNSLAEPTKTIALIAWEYATDINQYSPTTLLIQQACGLTDEEVNEIFNQAEQINI